MREQRIRSIPLRIGITVGLIVVWVNTITQLEGCVGSEAASGEAASRHETEPTIEELRKGKAFLQTPVYSEEEDAKILKLFEGLRVADICDAMDQVGLRNVGLMSPEIHPAWKDPVELRHRFVGIAVTVRYVPSNLPSTGPLSPEEFDRWMGEWYQKLSPEPFVPLIRPGTVVVIDDAERADVGTIGSNNILSWKKRGCVAVVTDATARDLDEIALEKVPLYLRGPGRGVRPGRNLIESVNRPVEVGGVLVRPGDVVAGDSDGVIVVPREFAEQVASYARKTLETDKAGRRRLYESLGIPEDVSVK